MEKLNVLDLFSGSGMFSLGLERTGGFETVGFCEIEEYPRKVLRRHWPTVPIYTDIRSLSGEEAGTVDVICGGFPCQDLSVAGKGAGLSGQQSGLWSEFRRLIGEIRPGWVILENVANLLSGPPERSGEWFGRLLADLAALGYDAEWHCIPLTYFGAPNNRDRVWVVAYPKRDEQPRQEPRLREIGRMGRLIKPVSWDRDWKGALSEFRRVDAGDARSVDRTDMIRNSLCPLIPEMIGNAILATLEAEGGERQ